MSHLEFMKGYLFSPGTLNELYIILCYHNLSAESKKGINAVQPHSVENQ